MAKTDSTSDRTMAPTKRRLDEARSRGEVARSGDLSAAVLAIGALVVLAIASGGLVGELTAMMRTMLSGAASADSSAAWESVAPVAGSLGIILVSLVALAITVNVMQVGVLTATRRVQIDWSRISMSAGFGKMFSARTAARVLQTLAKLGVVSVVAYMIVRGRMGQIVACCSAPPAEIMSQAGSLLLGMGLRIGVAMLALGLADMLYQRWQWRRDLRMTRREVMDELKDSQGGLPARSRHEATVARGLAAEAADTSARDTYG